MITADDVQATTAGGAVGLEIRLRRNVEAIAQRVRVLRIRQGDLCRPLVGDSPRVDSATAWTFAGAKQQSATLMWIGCRAFGADRFGNCRGNRDAHRARSHPR